MVNPNYSSMGGLLGFRASRKAPLIVATADQDDAVSIVSIATNRSQRFNSTDNWKETRKKIKNDNSSSRSVMSDVTCHTMSAVPEDNNESLDSTSSTHEFIVECENGERIYVPSMQGELIKSRCRHFRVSLGSSGDGVLIVGGPDSDGNTKEQEDKSKRDNRILAKETWSSRTARHIIELLTEGTTWIENDHRRFIELSRACGEINVHLCLGSPINYHDILDRASTL